MANSEASLSGKKVVVGLTGRIDSCVAAFLLKKQGMDVIGVSLVQVPTDIAGENNYPKCHILDLISVQKFCETIGIRFYASDAKVKFQDNVIEKIIANKLGGLANQSCFNCNQMRMQVLYEKMLQLKADYISTGHYARVQKNLQTNEFYVHNNLDTSSDQSFLLGHLPQHILKHLILPLGDLKKTEVVKIAKNYKLDKLESDKREHFCFGKKESVEVVLKRFVPKSLVHKGQIIDKHSGRVLCDHEGVMFHYMTEKEVKNLDSNMIPDGLEITHYDEANHNLYVGEKKDLTANWISVYDFKLPEGLDQSKPMVSYFKYKYSKNFLKGKVFFKNNNTAVIELETDLYPLLFDEVLVFYDKNIGNAKIIGTAKLATRGQFELIDRVDIYRDHKNENQVEDDEHAIKKDERPWYHF